MFRTYIDTRLIKYLSIFYGIAVLIKFSKQAYWKYVEGSYDSLTWFELILHEAVVDWSIVVVFMIFISYITDKLIAKKIRWVKFILLHLILSIILGCFTIVLRAVGYGMMGDFDLENSILSNPIRTFIGFADKYFLVYFSMVGIIYVYHYIKKVKNIELQKSRLETQMANTRLKMLKSQLHPHFMFNTLNSISSLIEIDKEKSQNLIADFGDLFREMLEFKDQNLVPLQQELSLLDKYIDIISVRFSDHLIINKQIENGLENVLVPSLIIQPLLENAVKYGYSYDITELVINLKIYKEGEYVCLHIENDGSLLKNNFSDLTSQGLGIQNTKDRLFTLFGNDYKFSVKNNDQNNGVVAFIRFPRN